MANFSVYMFNQTNLQANIIINNGTQFTITGTSDTLKWVAGTSVQTYQSVGTTPGNFNQGGNTLLINLGNNTTYSYGLNIANTNPGSIQVHIFFYDTGQTYAGLIMLYEGQPLTQPPVLVAPVPAKAHKQFA
jgi:hypothetical protein